MLGWTAPQSDSHWVRDNAQHVNVTGAAGAKCEPVLLLSHQCLFALVPSKVWTRAVFLKSMPRAIVCKVGFVVSASNMLDPISEVSLQMGPCVLQ